MALSIQERYKKAKEILVGLKASTNYTAQQKKALGFAVKMLVSLAPYEEQKFQDAALDVYRLIHPHREFLDQQMMLLALYDDNKCVDNTCVDNTCIDDKEKVIQEVMHALPRYHLLMLDYVEETLA